MLTRKETSNIAKVLRDLESAKGFVLPQDVVEEAKPTTSPIHHLFDWDNRVAAEKHRLHQARMLINTVSVTIIDRDYQAYQNVRIQVGDVQLRGYVSTQRALDDESMREQIVSQAVREIDYWQTKYNSIRELMRVINKDQYEKVKSKARNVKV